jgi:hypothetical protein
MGYKEKLINFNEILMVTRWIIKKRTNPCFAIFIKETTWPYIFEAASEKVLNDWLAQMSIYCAKISNISSLLFACTAVSTSGFAYFAYLNKTDPKLFTQIGNWL